MSTVIGNRSRSATMSSVMMQLTPAALICLIFAAVGILHVTSRVQVMTLGFQLSTLESESRDLTRETDQLKLELATLKGPARVERYARQNLGMGPPPATSIVLLGGGTSPTAVGRNVPGTRPARTLARLTPPNAPVAKEEARR